MTTSFLWAGVTLHWERTWMDLMLQRPLKHCDTEPCKLTSTRNSCAARLQCMGTMTSLHHCMPSVLILIYDLYD